MQTQTRIAYLEIYLLTQADSDPVAYIQQSGWGFYVPEDDWLTDWVDGLLLYSWARFEFHCIVNLKTDQQIHALSTDPADYKGRGVLKFDLPPGAGQDIGIFEETFDLDRCPS